MTPIEKITSTASTTGEVNGAANHAPAPRPGRLTPEEQAALKAKIDALNPRRLDLIDKEFHGGGLTPQEQAELERLQTEVGRLTSRLFPLPYETLEKIEAVARREGLLRGEPS